MTSTIQAAYDKWSATYDTQENPTRDLDKEFLQSRLTELRGKTVVEIGCGTGKNTMWVAPQCLRLIALDFSVGMMLLARQKVQATNITFIRANILNPLPLSANLADVIIINLVLEHIEHLTPMLHEVYRVLRSGGQVIVSEIHPSRTQQGKGAVIAETEEFVGTFHHTAEDFLTAFKAAGFGDVSVNDWYWSESPPESGKSPLIITFEATKD